MKKISIISLMFLMLACLNACDKKQPTGERTTMGRAKVSINDAPWQCDWLAIIPTNNDSELFNVMLAQGGNIKDHFSASEIMSIQTFKNILGRQKLYNLGDFSEAVADFKVVPYGHSGAICDWFLVDTTNSAANWLEIYKEEDDFKKIWARFEMKMYKKEPNMCDKGRNYPDTIRVKGEFFAAF